MVSDDGGRDWGVRGKYCDVVHKLSVRPAGRDFTALIAASLNFPLGRRAGRVM